MPDTAAPHRTLRVGDRGPDVEALQHAVNRRLDARGLDRYMTQADGEYGPDTALACRKAVWALGGMLSTVRAITGGSSLTIGAQQMIRYPGRRERAQLTRAKDRARELAQAAKRARTATSGRAASLKWASQWVGTTEQPPGSNGGPHISGWQAALGFGRVAWCGIFAGHALRAAGVQGVTAKIASVWWIEADARGGRAPFSGWSATTAGVKPGDLVVIGGRGVHVELVREVIDANTVRTIGGNTSFGPGGSQSNGGCVAARTRSGRELYGFAHVRYP